MELAQIALLAILIEALVETVKPLWDNEKPLDRDRVGSLVAGVAITVLAQVDLFTAVGLPLVHAIPGMILSGVILSRGSQYVHDLIGKLKPAA